MTRTCVHLTPSDLFVLATLLAAFVVCLVIGILCLLPAAPFGHTRRWAAGIFCLLVALACVVAIVLIALGSRQTVVIRAAAAVGPVTRA